MVLLFSIPILMWLMVELIDISSSNKGQISREIAQEPGLVIGIGGGPGDMQEMMEDHMRDDNDFGRVQIN